MNTNNDNDIYKNTNSYDINQNTNFYNNAFWRDEYNIISINAISKLIKNLNKLIEINDYDLNIMKDDWIIDMLNKLHLIMFPVYDNIIDYDLLLETYDNEQIELIKLTIENTNCSLDIALKYLNNNNNDVVKTIIDIENNI